MPESLNDLVRRVDDIIFEAIPDPDGLPLLFGFTDAGLEVVHPPLHLDHPVPMLDEFDVPSSWWALGVIAAGKATHLEDGPLGRMRVTYAISRTGEEVSFLRLEGEETVPSSPGPMVGLIPEACRRALGCGGPH